MGEVLQAALDEIATRPAAFAAEVVQALILVAIVTWAVRRLAGKRLEDRRARVAAALAEAEREEHAADDLAAEARDVVARAEVEAPRIVASARDETEKERAAAIAAVEAEAAQLVQQARQTVEREEGSVRREASERLVRLTTETARRYLDEFLSDAERRAMTEKAILETLEELDRGAPPRTKGEPS